MARRAGLALQGESCGRESQLRGARSDGGGEGAATTSSGGWQAGPAPSGASHHWHGGIGPQSECCERALHVVAQPFEIQPHWMCLSAPLPPCCCGWPVRVRLNCGAHFQPLRVQGPLVASVSRTRVVNDEATAAQLFQLAKSSGDAAEFSLKLQKAGLMAGASSASGGGSSTSGSSSDASSSSSTSTAKAGGLKKGGGVAKNKGVVPQLSRELAHGYARDGIIIVTWANFHFLDFTLNWVHHMEVGAAPGTAAPPMLGGRAEAAFRAACSAPRAACQSQVLPSPPAGRAPRARAVRLRPGCCTPLACRCTASPTTLWGRWTRRPARFVLRHAAQLAGWASAC